jgi:hypothetical protein
MDQPSTPPPSSQLPAHRSMSLGASPPWMLLIIAGCAGLVLGMVAMMSVLQTDQTAVDPQPGTGTNATTTTVDISAEELAELQNAAGEIPVIWQSPEKVDPTKEFPGANLLAVIPYNYNQYGSLDDLPTTAVATSTFSYYRRGNIAGTPDTLFSGDAIYLVIADNLKNTYSEMGIGEPAIPPSFYLIKHTLPGSRVIRYIAFTGREGEGYMPTDGFMPGNNLVISTTNLHLPRSSFPETITLQNGKILHRSPTQPTSFLTATTALCTDEGCPNKTPIAKTTDGQSVYAGLSIGTNFNSFDQPGCLAIFAPSGEAQLYVSTIETTEIDPGRSYENHPFPMLTTKGLELDAAYTLASSTAFIPFAMGGCGGLGCPEVLLASATSTPTMDQLKQIGKTKAGEPIYLPKDLRKSEISQSVYEMWYEYDTNGKKPSFDAFLQRFSVPYFLWKDALGRFVLYRNNQFVPLAECGKPVIYLYPTTPRTVQITQVMG